MSPALSEALRQAVTDATVVFDLDGTLVDTAPDLVGTLNLLLADQNLPSLSVEAIRPMIGAGAKVMIERGFAAAGEPLDPGRVPALFARFIDVYQSRIADESAPFPGAVEAVDVLRAAGARLAICTNKRTGLSVQLLEALGIADRFDSVVGADSVAAPKPDAGHLIAAVEQAGGRLDRALMVGDSGTDAAAARAAGVPLVLVSFGYTETPAAKLGADILIDHFDELAGACTRLLAPLAAPCPAPSQEL